MVCWGDGETQTDRDNTQTKAQTEEQSGTQTDTRFKVGFNWYEATHRLKEQTHSRPAGTPVAILATRLEKPGTILALVVSKMRCKQANSHSFVVEADKLEKLERIRKEEEHKHICKGQSADSRDAS